MFVHCSKNDIKNYENAQAEWARYSKTDDILYGMCRSWPHHKDLGIVQAKVTIIARTYAAGIERKGGKDKAIGILETITNILHKNAGWIDPRIIELKRLRRFSSSSAVKVLQMHGDLVRLLRSGTKSKINFRSFVSKYLHFHTPIVPIFDSLSSQTINKPDWYPWREYRSRAFIGLQRPFDKTYYRFLMQFLFCFLDLQELGLNPSVRRVDYFLIDSAP